MAHLFEGDVPTLMYQLRAHGHPGRRNDRFWFCWPALAYRVVAPVQRTRQMNVLQRTILGVLRSTNLTAQEIAVRLGIHRELVAHVVMELQVQGRLNEDWEITERGRCALLNEEAAEAELEAAWVFQDPWTRDLWPFVVSDLQQANVTIASNKRRSLQLGSTGSPWTQSLWTVEPPDISKHIPSPSEILRASRRQRRFQDRAQRMDQWEGDDLSQPIGESVSLSRITTIQDTPEPVFFVSYLYGIQGQRGHDWYACDFFGFGSNPTLRRQFNDVARKFPPLQTALSQWLGKTTVHKDFGALQEMLQKIQQEAKSMLYRCMTAHIADHTEEAERLQRIFSTLYEIHVYDTFADMARYELVLSECRKTLEFFFSHLAEDFPLRGVYNDMSQNADINKALISRAASDIGLNPPPESFLRVRKNLVKSVSEHNDAWRLRPLIVATLLASRKDPSHPFRRVATQSPDLLTTLDELASISGQASHANDKRWDFESLCEAVDCVTRTICLFRELPHQTVSDSLNG